MCPKHRPSYKTVKKIAAFIVGKCKLCSNTIKQAGKCKTTQITITMYGKFGLNTLLCRTMMKHRIIQITIDLHVLYDLRINVDI